MVPKYRLIIQASMNQMLRSMERLNASYELGLFLYKELPNAAIWNLSNCILTAIHMAEDQTELTLHPPGLMPPSDKAGKTWNEIGQLFLDIGWIEHFTPILIDDQSEYLDQFFKLVRSAESDEPAVDSEIGGEQAQAFMQEHDRVTHMTIEERAEDWLQRLTQRETPVLSELEQGIIAVYNELKQERVPISDERIATRLAIAKGIRNKYGQPYSRRWVCQVRNRLIEQGHDLEV